MEKAFTEQDLKYITARGNSLDKIQQQLHYFRNGISKMNLERSATKNDGILVFSEEEVQEIATYFDKHKSKYEIEKFVPASGAATRMFKSLNEFLTKFNPEKDTINSYVNLNKDKDLSLFIVGLRSFPFYNELKEKTKAIWSTINIFFAERSDKENYNNIWLIIPYDEAKVIQAFNEDESTDDKNEIGKGLIEKTFAVKFRVTPPIPTNWEVLFDELIIESFGEDISKEKRIDFDYVKRIFNSYKKEIITPREIINFINELITI